MYVLWEIFIWREPEAWGISGSTSCSWLTLSDIQREQEEFRGSLDTFVSFTLQSVRIEILFIHKTWINEYILITLCVKKDTNAMDQIAF